jgi:predicted HD superfamily hydrolase involved in NAD metabolism
MPMPELPGSGELLNKLAHYLRPGRVEHSRNVAAAAAALARLHAPELAQAAEVAGLVHDNAKRLEPGELLALAREHELPASPVEEANPALLHGKVGAALLPERFGINDAQIAAAVADHVTGRPGMGLLSLILYVADQIAADRDFPGVEDVRTAAQHDLRGAAWLVARHKLTWTVRHALLLEPCTLEVYNELLPFAPADGAVLGTPA